MEINYEINSDKNLVIIISGHFDLFRINNLKYSLEDKILEHQFNHLVLDLKDVLSIDSMGIAKLISLKRLMVKEKKKFQVLHMPDDIRKMLFHTQMDTFLLEDNENSSENYI